MTRLEGKVAPVAAAWSGTRAATARRLASGGAAVLVTGVYRDNAEAVAADIQVAGMDAIPHQLDVSDSRATSDVHGETHVADRGMRCT